MVTARSSVHDTEMVIGGMQGTVDAEAATLASDGARAEIEVDMSRADAGDFLKNRKLRKDLDLVAHPTARFVLETIEDVEEDGDRFRARLRGRLSWRGRELAVIASGEGTVTDAAVDATARFDLDMRDLGVTPPKVLMFKVEDVVSVAVSLRARAS